MRGGRLVRIGLSVLSCEWIALCNDGGIHWCGRDYSRMMAMFCPRHAEQAGMELAESSDSKDIDNTLYEPAIAVPGVDGLRHRQSSECLASGQRPSSPWKTSW